MTDDLLGLLQQEHGYLHPNNQLAKAVGETDDLRRIRDARARDWQSDPDLDRAVRLLTSWLRPGQGLCVSPCKGCEAQELKPAQAMALLELWREGAGLFAPMRVGAGKTLVSLLAGTVIGARQVLLVVPADLVPKTKLEALQYARHWRVGTYTLKSYEWLSNPKNKDYLEQLQPDLVILDEADKVKNTGSKAWRRLARRLARAPNTRVIALTGSPSSRSLSEYWHYLRASLKSKAPVPHDPLEMSAWCQAMDEKISPEARYEPGALLTLGHVENSADLDPTVHARLAFQARLVSTPGVVSTLEDIPDVPLRLWTTEVELPEHLVETIETMRGTWATPDGHDFSLAVDMWRHCRTLGCGLYYAWDPYPPAEWMAARRAWHTFARDWLKYHRQHDSAVHLKQLIREGQVQDGGVLEAWGEIEPTFKPNSVPVWCDDTVLRWAGAWLERERGICWVEHRAFGERLSAMTGVPYFGRKGLDQGGRLIDLVEQGPLIASIKACGRGHNLQALSKNMFPSFPSKGSIAEQTLGRTHRDGQKAAEVTGEIVVTCRESYTSLAQAVRDAMHTQQTLGQPQKLCYADRELGPVEDLVQSNENWKEVGI